MPKKPADDRLPAVVPVKLVGVRLPIRTAAMLRVWSTLTGTTMAGTAEVCIRHHLQLLLEQRPKAFQRAFRAAVDQAAKESLADAEEGLDKTTRGR